MDLFELPRLLERRRAAGERYLEFLRVPALSAGIYALPASGVDPQRPHGEDEVYYVTAGRGAIRIGHEDRAVGPGTIVYVPAGVDHRFHSITDELQVLVLFAPAESTSA
ncbi:MAG TPA: cupin domain-containing protein [Gemmatimonadales bacterium]|jgi:mannose-6-phosphate isomerase-like protein (cupin superfamily)|nr:cupin domain-containing protein [Gemmatimonadales bacterium]